MTLGSRPHFRLHSERAEQDRLCAGLLYGVQKGVPAVGMIAIYDYGTGFFMEDDILDGLCPSEKPWLQASELYQHPQQRRDDFVARENQHRTQHDQPRGDEASGQLMDLTDRLAYQVPCLDIQEQMSTLFATSQRVGKTICSNASELTLGKYHEGAAYRAHRAVETARRSDAGTGELIPENR